MEPFITPSQRKMNAFNIVKPIILNETTIQHLIAMASSKNKTKVKIFEHQELQYTNGFLYKDIIENSVVGLSLLDRLKQLFISPYVIYGKTIKRGSLFSVKRSYYQVFIKWN